MLPGPWQKLCQGATRSNLQGWMGGLKQAKPGSRCSQSPPYTLFPTVEQFSHLPYTGPVLIPSLTIISFTQIMWTK
jgi:hypothetical protein